MIKEFKSYRDWAGRILVAIVAITGYIINKYFDWGSRLSGLEEILLYSGLTALAVGTEYVLAKLPDQSSRIRNRLLKNKNIEGVWVEVAHEEGSQIPYAIGYCFIRVENDMFVIDGHAFLYKTQKQDNWKSVCTILNSDGDLDVLYKLPSSKTGRAGDVNCYCKYSFTISLGDIPPDYYTGSWVYPLDQKQYFCEGKKIADEKLAAIIQSRHQRDFRKCLEICRTTFPNKFENHSKKRRPNSHSKHAKLCLRHRRVQARGE